MYGIQGVPYLWPQLKRVQLAQNCLHDMKNTISLRVITASQDPEPKYTDMTVTLPYSRLFWIKLLSIFGVVASGYNQVFVLKDVPLLRNFCWLRLRGNKDIVTFGLLRGRLHRAG